MTKDKKKKYTYFISYHWQRIESSFKEHSGFGNVTSESNIIVPLAEIQETFGPLIEAAQPEYEHNKVPGYTHPYNKEIGKTTIIILFTQYEKNKE